MLELRCNPNAVTTAIRMAYCMIHQGRYGADPVFNTVLIMRDPELTKEIRKLEQADFNLRISIEMRDRTGFTVGEIAPFDIQEKYLSIPWLLQTIIAQELTKWRNERLKEYAAEDINNH